MTENVKLGEIAPVKLSGPNPAWSIKFNEVKAEIENAVGSRVISLEHIGSTSIPGLLAKPEIDIVAGVKTLEDADNCIELLEAAGYQYFKRFEEFIPERRYFRKSEGVTPLVHIHMVEISSNFWKEHIIFRNYLRAHPEKVDEYADLKQELLASSEGDRGVYQDGKVKFIKGIIELAQNEGGY